MTGGYSVFQVMWLAYPRDASPYGGPIFSTREIAKAYVERNKRFRTDTFIVEIEEQHVDYRLDWRDLPDDRCAFFVWFDMADGTAEAHAEPIATKMPREEIWDEIAFRNKIRVDVWASSAEDAIVKATAKRDEYLARKDAA